MDGMIRRADSAPVETGEPNIELGKWMGRREAFGAIAGRCSAAEIESLRQIRDGRLYQQMNLTWEEFCARQLHASKRTVDREISYLRRFGPAFFTLRQLARISIREYALIAGQISQEGVNVDGNVVALIPENSAALAGAVGTLLQRSEPAAPASPPAAPFDTVLQRFRGAAEGLRAFDGGMDGRQQRALAVEIADLLAAAAERGVTIGAR